MPTVSRWSWRLGAVLAAAATGLLAPTAAWAQPATATVTGATLAGGKAIAVAGGLSLLCCLLAVAAVAGTITMIIRRRRR